MPVIFNEPLSFLQRLTEYMEHTYLIHQANTTSDSIERMKVSTFFLGIVASNTFYLCFEFGLCDLMCVCVFIGSAWLRSRCPLWPPSGSAQVNPSTLCWERPMNWSGKRYYTLQDTSLLCCCLSSNTLTSPCSSQR